MIFKNTFLFLFSLYNLSIVSFLPLLFILSLVCIIPVAYAGRESEFNDYLSQTNTFKDSALKNTSGFAPEKVFDNYSSTPVLIKYYSEDSGGSVQNIKSDSIVKVDLDNEGKAITDSSKIRPQFKVNSESEEIKKGKEIQKSAISALKMVSDDFLESKDIQVDTELTKYVVKTCNEEIRPLTKICTKSPFITTATEVFGYPNCRKAYVDDGLYTSCASGYSSIVNVDRKEIYIGGGYGWGIARLCVKPADPEEKTACLAGYLAYGAGSGIGGGNARLSTSPTTVPQNMHARVAFYGATHKVPMKLTLINKTTNKTVYDGNYSNGIVIELPFSETQDQTFEYYFTQDSPGFFSRHSFQTGLMCLYIDNVATRKVAKIDWREVCRDV